MLINSNGTMMIFQRINSQNDFKEESGAKNI